MYMDNDMDMDADMDMDMDMDMDKNMEMNTATRHWIDMDMTDTPNSLIHPPTNTHTY